MSEISLFTKPKKRCLTGTLAWPPPYQLRISKRAKYMRMQVTRQKGLEIIIPHGCARTEVDGFIEAQKSWIQKHNVQIYQKADAAALITELQLRAVDEHYSIHYQKTDDTKVRLHQCAESELVIQGATDDCLACKGAIIQWLKRQAKQVLSTQLQQLSHETQLSYQSLSIRGQTTRWGSCSSQQNISLNFKLLFLPPSIMRYVLIHELCHTKHLNHSKVFWALVEKYDSQYREHKKLLSSQAERWLPGWL